VVVDVAKENVYEVGSDVKVDWDSFINAYAPKVLVEQI
jgi:hypothetical protein